MNYYTCAIHVPDHTGVYRSNHSRHKTSGLIITIRLHVAYGGPPLFLKNCSYSLVTRRDTNCVLEASFGMLVFWYFCLAKIPEHYGRFVSAVVNLRLHQSNREV